MTGRERHPRAVAIGLVLMLTLAGLWRTFGPPTRADVLATVRALRSSGDTERAAVWLDHLLAGGAPGVEVERERDLLIRELLRSPSPRRRALAWNLAQSEVEEWQPTQQASHPPPPVPDPVTASPTEVAAKTPQEFAPTPAPVVAKSAPTPTVIVAPVARESPRSATGSPPVGRASESPAPALALAREREAACDFSGAAAAARRAWELGAAGEVEDIAGRIERGRSELARANADFEVALAADEEDRALAAVATLERLCPDAGLADTLRARWNERAALPSVSIAVAPASTPALPTDLGPVCAALAGGDWARAVVLLDGLTLTNEALESLAGTVYFNASLAAVRSGRCAEGRRLASRAARFDDPWRVPSNVGWWKTVVGVRDCTDFNLMSSLRFLSPKAPPAELCPSSVKPGKSM